MTKRPKHGSGDDPRLNLLGLKIRFLNDYNRLVASSISSFNYGYVIGAYDMYSQTVIDKKKPGPSKILENVPEELAMAKAGIKEFFGKHHGEAIGYMELLENTDFSLPLIVQACEELEREGQIAGIDQEEGS